MWEDMEPMAPWRLCLAVNAVVAGVSYCAGWIIGKNGSYLLWCALIAVASLYLWSHRFKSLSDRLLRRLSLI